MNKRILINKMQLKHKKLNIKEKQKSSDKFFDYTKYDYVGLCTLDISCIIFFFNLQDSEQGKSKYD